MYILDFPSARVFEIVFEGLFVSTGYSGGELRIVNNLFAKLESISILKPGVDGERGLRTLGNKDVIRLENSEFELLKKAFASTQWTAVGARVASIAYDWLDTLKPEKLN